ncbi:MAG TPA: hypothetical protein VNI52_00720 [Sphingobacteriaceae bacterium]|nr:hypothetical protein [Sphingobacteriaceae bacterium]
MPAQQAWDVANEEGKLSSAIVKRFWAPVEPFELYDLKTDSMEVENLVDVAKYSAQLKRLKDVLKNELFVIKDAGLMPPGYRNSIKKQGDLYTLTRNGKLNINEVVDAAIVASERNLKNVPALVNFLDSKNPSVQYWGASGLCGLAKVGMLTAFPPKAVAAFKKGDLIEEVNCMLAEGMIYIGVNKEPLNYLVQQIEQGSGTAAATLQNVGKKAMPVAEKIKELSQDKNIKNKFYLRSVLINCNIIPYTDLYKLAAGEEKPQF